eukprot:3338564-Rhodomonas_salina.2
MKVVRRSEEVCRGTDSKTMPASLVVPVKLTIEVFARMLILFVRPWEKFLMLEDRGSLPPRSVRICLRLKVPGAVREDRRPRLDEQK